MIASLQAAIVKLNGDIDDHIDHHHNLKQDQTVVA
jgi:hypothetical protein